ncbi:hypothetical protein Goari_005137 [Gossypium aridum]|uniref:Uncharacterized protein n=1 Tax=Gossypium aridum TaxID=34290 RepID=A0A7J8Y5M1_GOSAI|nr:hypothetical protein [Gossypium aridum]
MVDGVPSIAFSNCVHEYIERRMTRTIIVKLLGSRIAFNALLSRASLLWNPKYSIQMIDLENYFFLV